MKTFYLSKNLKYKLEQQQLSLSQLARQIGVNKSTLHNYLIGIEPKSARTLVSLAEHFSVKVDDLLIRNLSQSEGGIVLPTGKPF